MSFTVNSDAEIEVAKRGWEIIQEQKEGSTWKAIKHVEYSGAVYKTMVINNVVVRDSCFTEDFILAFIIENFPREVEVRCTYLKLQDLLSTMDSIVGHISKYVVAIADISEDTK